MADRSPLRARAEQWLEGGRFHSGETTRLVRDLLAALPLPSDREDGERLCICADPENCRERIPGYVCKRDLSVALQHPKVAALPVEGPAPQQTEDQNDLVLVTSWWQNALKLLADMERQRDQESAWRLQTFRVAQKHFGENAYRVDSDGFAPWLDEQIEALAARCRTLEHDLEQKRTEVEVLRPGAVNYNPMRIRAEKAEAECASLRTILEKLDVEALRADCHGTYNGGWVYAEGKELEAFHHGMDTVCNVLGAVLAPVPPQAHEP